MKREQIESTPWAQAFKLDSPVSYLDAIRYALESKLEVIVDRTDENGEWVWAIRVFVSPEFWMDAVPTKKAATELCRAMGWRIKS